MKKKLPIFIGTEQVYYIPELDIFHITYVKDDNAKVMVGLAWYLAEWICEL